MQEPHEIENDDNEDEDSRLRYKLLDAMLSEAVLGAEAPDLSDRIATELGATTTDLAPHTDASSAGSLTTASSTTGSSIRPDRRLVQRAAIAMAAGFLLAFLTLFAVRGSDRAAAVRVAVLQGEPDYIAGKRPHHFVTNDKADILLAVGDRFSTQADGGAVLHLQPLGILTLSDHTTVEVLSMNWTKRDGSLVLASLTVGAIAGGFTWNSITGDRVEAGESQPLVAESAAEKPSTLVADLRGEIASLKKRNAQLETDSRREPIVEPKPDVEEPKPVEEEPAEIVALFNDPEFGDALAKIDWQTMGVNLNEMLPMISKLAEAIANGDEIPLELAGEIQKRNGALVVIAKAILDAKVPGSGINGSFSHPSVVSNQIGAVLQAAGLSLNKEQQQSMERIRSFYAAKDRSLRITALSRDFGIENLLEEVDFKNNFYNEARALLSPEQRAALSSDTIRGRTHLDVFDTGIILSQYARPVRVKDAADLAATWSRRMKFEVPLDAAGKKALNGILTSYANKFPPSFWEYKPDALDQKKMMKSSRIRDALRRQVEMMQQIMNTVPLSPKDLAALKKQMLVLVPYPR